ncbi:MAG: hypothetical protein ACFNND_05755 [Streptococcus sobrinus]
MEAVIRRYKGTGSEALATVDLVRYSIRQVIQSLTNHDVGPDEFQIVGFDDWNISYCMSLTDAYRLKDYVESECDSDEYLVKYLLKKGWSVSAIISRRFSFVNGGDRKILEALFEGRSTKYIADLVYTSGSAKEIILGFMSTGKVVLTPKGYYISSYCD